MSSDAKLDTAVRALQTIGSFGDPRSSQRALDALAKIGSIGTAAPNAGLVAAIRQDADRGATFEDLAEVFGEPAATDICEACDGHGATMPTRLDPLGDQCQECHGAGKRDASQDVAGSTPASASTVAGSRMPEGERGVDPAETAGDRGEDSRKRAHFLRPVVIDMQARAKPLELEGNHVHTCPTCHEHVPCCDRCAVEPDLVLDDGTERGAFVECVSCAGRDS